MHYLIQCSPRACVVDSFLSLTLLLSQPSLCLRLTSSPVLLLLSPGYNSNSPLSSISRVNTLVQGTLLLHLAFRGKASPFHSGSHPIYKVTRITLYKCISTHIAPHCKILVCDFTHTACSDCTCFSSLIFSTLCLFIQLQAHAGFSLLEHV